MKLTEFEHALLAAVVEHDGGRDRRVTPHLRSIDASERSMSGCGFMTELRGTAATQIFDKGVSLRLGEATSAVLNGHERVGVVVYVDDGKLTALEAYTFGGNPWPAEIREFRIEHQADQA